MRPYFFVLLLALTTLQCAKPEPEPAYTGPVFGPGPKRIVVISLDCLRADRLSCYGHDRPTSPNLDALSGQGVRFSRATAPFNWTLPSHTSLFTGLFARGHGVRKENQAVSAEIPSLVEPLREAGYATAAFTGGAYLASMYGHDRGFDTFWSTEKDHIQWSEILERGGDWLGDHAEQDVFLFLHTYEIHMPYKPPLKYVREILGYHRTDFMGEIREIQRYLTGARPKIADEIKGRYDSGILYTDDLLGGFLARLEQEGLTENMLLIVSSDHGEAFWEHGRWGHNGDLLGPQLTDVPLIVRMPRAIFPELAGQVRDDEVSFLDIMPTVLDAAGLEPGSDIDGFSLLPELIGRPVSAADAAARARRTVRIDGDERLVGLCESRNYVSLRAGGWSVVLPGPAWAEANLEDDVSYHEGLDLKAWPALYRIADDPGELSPRPLAGKTAAELGDAAARLAGRPGQHDVTPSEIQIPPRLRRRLDALGYL